MSAFQEMWTNLKSQKKYTEIRVPVMIAIKRFVGAETIDLAGRYVLSGKELRTLRCPLA